MGTKYCSAVCAEHKFLLVNTVLGDQQEGTFGIKMFIIFFGGGDLYLNRSYPTDSKSLSVITAY